MWLLFVLALFDVVIQLKNAIIRFDWRYWARIIIRLQDFRWRKPILLPVSTELIFENVRWPYTLRLGVGLSFCILHLLRAWILIYIYWFFRVLSLVLGLKRIELVLLLIWSIKVYNRWSFCCVPFHFFLYLWKILLVWVSLLQFWEMLAIYFVVKAIEILGSWVSLIVVLLAEALREGCWISLRGQNVRH